MASFRPALTEAPQRHTAHWDHPVNSGPRPCLFNVGFPLSGLQDRTHTSDLNVRARHTCASPYGLSFVSQLERLFPGRSGSPGPAPIIDQKLAE